MQCMLRLVSQDGFAPEGMQAPLHASADAALLDAYSRAVISAVEQVSPSVVNIEGFRQSPRSHATGRRSAPVMHSTGCRLDVTLADGRRVPADLVGDDPSRCAGGRLSVLPPIRVSMRVCR